MIGDLIQAIVELLGWREGSRRRGEAFAADPNFRVAYWAAAVYFVMALGLVLYRVSHMPGLGPNDDLPLLLVWTLAIAGGAVSGPGLLWLFVRRRWRGWGTLAVILATFASAIAATFVWQLLFVLYARRAASGD